MIKLILLYCILLTGMVFLIIPETVFFFIMVFDFLDFMLTL